MNGINKCDGNHTEKGALRPRKSEKVLKASGKWEEEHL